MSYSEGRFNTKVFTPAGTSTGTWAATGSAAVGTCTALTFPLPRAPHVLAIVGARIYRTGTGGTFTGVKAIAYNGTNVLGTSSSFTLNATTDELKPVTFSNGRKYPFYSASTDTAVATLTMKLTGTTTASIAATNEILTVVFDTVEPFAAS
jgi:hypothetical protein